MFYFWDDLRAKAEHRYGNKGGATVVKALLADGAVAMCLYRLMQWSRRRRLAPLEMLCNRLNAILSNCLIGRGAEFGPRFVLLHATGVVINGKVRGGADIRVEHQVTIGEGPSGNPVLGNDIYIGAGAKIFGGVRIGDGARIGANAVVVDDVPAHSTVVGIPARVVRQRVPEAVGEADGEAKNGQLVEVPVKDR